MAMLMDLYSRKIIGWAIDLTMTQRLVLAALQEAICQRQPCPSLIHHIDRGGQYAGTKYREVLSRAQMRQSMSRAGDCYDNALMESCFGTIKTELEKTCYQSLEHARREIEELINYYDAICQHSSLDYQSPITNQLRASPSELREHVSAKPGPPQRITPVWSAVGIISSRAEKTRLELFCSAFSELQTSDPAAFVGLKALIGEHRKQPK
jgi:transposase InsO family protein